MLQNQLKVHKFEFYLFKGEVLGLVFRKILGCSLLSSYIFLFNIKNTSEAESLLKTIWRDFSYLLVPK